MILNQIRYHAKESKQDCRTLFKVVENHRESLFKRLSASGLDLDISDERGQRNRFCRTM